MSEFPRYQKIAALLAVSIVVIVTLAAISASGSNVDDDDTTAAANAEAEPINVPILERPRALWSDIAPTIRGAENTTSPVPCSYVDEREPEPNNFLSLTPALTFICDQRGLPARPIAPGRVVMIIDQPPLNSFKADLVSAGNDGPWLRAVSYGPFVVIDHGPLNGTANATSVYAALDSINPDLRLGQLVDTSTDLGVLSARMVNDTIVNGVLAFEFLSDDTRFGSDPLRDSPVSAAQSSALAAKLAPSFRLPAPTCTLPFGNNDLVVGAPREYRSGTHNGLDFNCGTVDHEIVASADGQVIFVVDDYVDAPTEDRNGVLANAAQAIDTPFWTLAMLYGNVVVMDHEIPGVDGHVVTISAHLSEVAENIVPGALIEAGTVLGQAGNRGTSTASAGVLDNDGSVHLHWELHVNDRPVGYLQDPVDTEPLYRQILCGASATDAGC